MTPAKVRVNIIDLGSYYRINVIYNESINELMIKYPRATESYIANLREGKVICESTSEVISPTKELMRTSATTSSATSTTESIRSGTSSVTIESSSSTSTTSAEVVRGGASVPTSLTYALVATALVTSLVIAYLLIRRRRR